MIINNLRIQNYNIFSEIVQKACLDSQLDLKPLSPLVDRLILTTVFFLIMFVILTIPAAVAGSQMTQMKCIIKVHAFRNIKEFKLENIVWQIQDYSILTKYL